MSAGTNGTGGVSGPPAALRSFLADAMPGFRREWGGRTDFPARLAFQRMLHAEGWVALGWPADIGGRGLGVADRVRCDAEFARVGAPVIAGVLGVNNVGPTIAAFGTAEQRRSLPRILSGKEVWCQGFSEPDAGSDLASLRTRAVRDGEEFVVTGQKVWTSDGMHATHCQLLVRTNPDVPRHSGISCLLVRLDLTGVVRRPLRQMTGEAEFAELFFEHVRVPASALLGPLDDGWRVTMTTLSYERAGVIAMAARLEPLAREVMAVFAEAGGDDAVLRQEVVRRYVEARVVALLGERALASVDQGGEPGAEHSVIKLAWSLVHQRLGETMLRVSGPAAMATDHEARDTFLRARASTIAAGTTEVMRNILGERVLGLPR